MFVRVQTLWGPKDIETAHVVRVNRSWLGGRGVQLDMRNGAFLVLTRASAESLDRQGLLPR